MTPDYIVQMNHISKHFGGVTALEDVKLNVVRGEIHALIGENGAGKSTLMKILAGAYPKDEGTIIIDGQGGDDRHATRHDRNGRIGHLSGVHVGPI